MADEETLETPEDDSIDIASDEELAFLLDDEEEEEGQASEPKPKSAAVPAAPSLSDEDKAILAQLRGNPDAVRRILEPVVQPQQPIQQQPPQPPEKPFDIEAFGDEFERDIIASPKTAGKKLLGMIAGIVKKTREDTLAEVASRYDTAMSGSAENAIDAYATNRTSELDDDEKVEFNTIVERARKTYGAALGKMPVSEINKGLDAAKAEAVGNVMLARRKQGKKTTSAAAPAYSPPGGGGSVRPAPREGTGKGGRLTKDEELFVRDLKAAGVKDKKIKEALAEMRAGIWETATGNL